MPQITISISEASEAKILDCIRKRRDFKIDGGQVWDGEKMVFLRHIGLAFHKCGASRGNADERTVSRE
jgi:hypothetical protein